MTDRTYLFLLEVLRKRPQDSARRHAVVHSISPAACRDGGLPSGGHLFPPAGHLLELHQSNVSQHCALAFSSLASLPARTRARAPHLFRVIIFYHPPDTLRLRVSRAPTRTVLEMPRSMLTLRAGLVYVQPPVFVGGYSGRELLFFFVPS